MDKLHTILLILFTLFSSNIAKTQCNLADNLKIHFPFDGDAFDSVNNVEAILVNGVSYTEDRFGNPNSAVYLDGTNQHLIVPHLADFNAYPFSLSFWFLKENDTIDSTPSSPNNLEGILFKGAHTNAGGRTFSFCLLYTSPSPRDATLSRMPSSA